MNEIDSTPEERVKLDRRQFLKLALAAAAGTMLVEGDSNYEKHGYPGVLFLDGIKTPFLAANRLLGFRDFSSGMINLLRKRPGVVWNFLRGKYGTAIPAELIGIEDDSMKTVMALGGLSYFGGHRDLSVATFEQNVDTTETNPPQSFPVNEAIKDFKYEELNGQPWARVRLDGDEVAAIIQDNPQANIVNLGLQFGELNIFVKTQEGETIDWTGYEVDGKYMYPPLDENGKPKQVNIIAKDEGEVIYKTGDGEALLTEAEAFEIRLQRYGDTLAEMDNPELFIIEPLSPLQGEQKQREHLDELIDACNSNARVLHVAAVGTFGSDIVKLRRIYEKAGLWPSNLILAGAAIETTNGYVTHGAGADIYIPGRVGQMDSSSEAVAFVTALAHRLNKEEPDQSPEELKRLIVKFAKEETEKVKFRIRNSFDLRFIKFPEHMPKLDSDLLKDKEYEVNLFDLEMVR